MLRKIREYSELVRRNRVSVRLELNEAAKTKARQLRLTLDRQEIPPDLLKWRVHNLRFEEAFDLLYPELERGNNLLFFDQQGMKFISDAVFQRITALERTDFIFFIASSFIRRFQDHDYFKKHLDILKGKIKSRAFTDTHRAVSEYYRSIVPTGRQLFLAPFSIKKGSNIYGIIFGSAHTLGIEKFLRVCWAMDKERGEANFDIDGEAIDSKSPHLFPEMDVAGKVQRFQLKLRGQILDRTLRTDAAVYIACLTDGMLPSHGRETVQAMMRSGEIRVERARQPRVSKDGQKEPRALEVVKDDGIKN